MTVGAGANVRTWRSRPTASHAPPRFLFVGKQWERKGGPGLLRRVRAAARRRFPTRTLAIAGPASLSVDQPGVEIAGPRVPRGGDGAPGRCADQYLAATAFVMPSLYEPLGVAVLEAMAAGLPCIGSTGGALPELIEEGVTGFVVPPGDEEALLARMRELARDPDLCRHARRGGRGPLPGAVHVGLRWRTGCSRRSAVAARLARIDDAQPRAPVDPATDVEDPVAARMPAPRAARANVTSASGSPKLV